MMRQVAWLLSVWMACGGTPVDESTPTPTGPKGDDPKEPALISRGLRLPCAPGTICKVIQGPGGKFTHSIYTRVTHAVDFVLAMGTPLYAVKSGRVGFLVQEHPDLGPCLSSSCTPRTNLLVVHHDDGTETAYWHLRQGFADELCQEQGICLAPGTPVRRGQVVALSGFSGYGDLPHLHLHAMPCCTSSFAEHRARASVPMHFVEAGEMPLQGAWTLYWSQNFPLAPDAPDEPVPGITIDLTEAHLTGKADGRSKKDGWEDAFFYAYAAKSAATMVTATASARVERTGLYWVESFVPKSRLVTSRHVPLAVVAPGGEQRFWLDQTHAAFSMTAETGGGAFQPVGGGDQRFKLIAGQEVLVRWSNETAEPRWQAVAFDALRLSFLADPPQEAPAEPCTRSAECPDELICIEGACREGCHALGCPSGSSCDLRTLRCTPAAP